MALYNVLFDIATRTAKFEEGMTRVDRRLEGMQRGAAKLTKNLAGVFATGLIARWVTNMAQAGDEMLSLAERTGRTVESVSQLQHIAERGNTTFEALNKAQDQLAKRLGATDEEGKAAAKALGELGLQAHNIRAMGFDQRLDAIADAMGSITDPTARARLEMALFGKTGTELDKILRAGADGVRALREEADRLGITLTTLEAERLSKLDDQIEITTGQWKKLKLELASLIAIPVAPYMELVTKGLMGWRAALGFTGSEFEELNDRGEELLRLQKSLIDQQRAGDNSVATMERIAGIKEEMALIQERQEYLLREATARARYESMTADLQAKKAAAAEAAAAKLEEDAKAAEKAAEAHAKLAAEIREVIDTERMVNSLELKFPTALLDDDQLERQLEGAGAAVRESAERNEKVFDGMFKRVKDSWGVNMEEIAALSDQAWRNIQTHAADFLFDPFSDGMKGLLKGFIDIIRRMIAEAAALQFVNLLRGGSNSGGFLGSILGTLFGSLGTGGAGRASYAGTFARGGHVGPGQWGIAGEEGPEPIFGGRTGLTVQPAGGGGASVTVAPVYNIDARGADEGLVKRLPGIIREANRAAVVEAESRIVEGIRRNRYRLNPA